uniref:Venom polypeptide n=1 Tax=Dolopus genitalis TaxID=2488630 RepID=A0A3G5BIF2_DOLGE|nr:venom polypeptide [Dolopus genitalis]
MKSFIVLSVIVALAFGHPQNGAVTFDGIENRIAGGQIAAPNQIPFQVRLSLTKNNMGRLVTSLCGGSIIASKVVITAAHCLEGAIDGVVHFGSTKTRPDESTYIGMRVKKQNFIIHERWSRFLLINDIALIILPKPIQFNSAVQPINLPKTGEENLENRMAVISGYGRMGDGQGTSTVLRFVPRRIVSGDVCKRTFMGKFRSTHVCVDGSDRKSACPGDSGGPLFVEESNGSRTLVGLTSFGRQTCESGFPIVYTRVSSYLPWIEKSTGLYF